MECPACQTPLPANAATCPTCGRQVAFDPDATMISSPRPQTPTSPPKSPPPAAPTEKPRAVAAPAQRPTPQLKGGSQAVFMDFNQSPREIVRVMDESRQKATAYMGQRKKYSRLLWLLFPLGLPFVLADVLLGYNICTFSLIALTLWAGAIFGLIKVARQGKVPSFGSKYELARTVFDTLRDDVSPQRTLVGWLDLTGAEQDSKKTRQKTSASGQPIHYYRDEWLRLKTGLYDGNVLRVSVIDRVKARQTYWRRSRSGKQKQRRGSSQSETQLEFSISVDTSRYSLQPFDPQIKTIPNSRFAIQEAMAGDGRVVVSAATNSVQFDAWDILNALQFGYDHIGPM